MAIYGVYSMWFSCTKLHSSVCNKVSSVAGTPVSTVTKLTVYLFVAHVQNYDCGQGMFNLLPHLP
jgi:hypothetical protein